MTFRTSALGLLALACLASPSRGAGPGVTVDGVRLGEQLYGPALKADDLKGRVVLLEFWGIH